jgi:ParB family transcriptional regulator, chromosome partitioning protein
VKAATQLVVEQIPVSQIQPSATNPRKHYDQAALEELAASIRSVGVQVPLSLRVRGIAGPNGERQEQTIYEIVGGERRWRAAQIAGLSSVPAIARVMTDAECREAQLVDNLQRADLSPMEEAECYDDLRMVGHPVEVLAAKVGKTVQYVTQRLRLLQLIPPAREAMRQGVLNLTIALLIARLEPATQEKATLYAVDPKRFMQGDLAKKIKSAQKHIEQDNGYWRCATESGMREWIAEHTLCVLKGVAWRLDDAELLPEAGACTTCPKRSGNAAMLFGDIAAGDNTCTDPECYGRKQKAAMKQALKASAGAVKLLSAESHLPLKEGATALKQGQWIEAKQGSCPQVMEGITEEGHRKMVCGDQKCKVHKHQVQQPLAKGQTANSWEAQNEARHAKQKIYVEAEEPIRLAIWAAIKPKLKGAKLLRAVLHDLAAYGGRADVVARLRGIAHEEYEATEPLRKAIVKAKDAELEGWLADLAAADALSIGAHMCDEVESDREDLWALGKLVGVDCDAIAKKLAPPPLKAKPAAPKKAAPAKPAKKKAAPKKLSAEGRKRIADAMRKRWAKKAGAR